MIIQAVAVDEATWIGFVWDTSADFLWELNVSSAGLLSFGVY